MARDGNGVFVTPNDDFVSGTTISSSEVDENFADIAAEITNSMPRDGQAAPTANIPFGNFKITGLGNGSSDTDSINYGQVRTGTITLTNKTLTSPTITSPSISGTSSLTGLLSVVVASAQQGYFGSTGANAAQVKVDNAAGGQATYITFQDATVDKWYFGKNGANQAIIYDTANSKTFINAAAGGALTLGAAQNFAIDQSGNATTLTQASNNSTTRIATTAFCNPANSQATNGYVKLSSGIILQWTTVGAIATGGSSTFSWPTAFASACYGAVATLIGGPTATPIPASISSVSTTQCTVCNASSVNNLQAYVWAWGV